MYLNNTTKNPITVDGININALSSASVTKEQVKHLENNFFVKGGALTLSEKPLDNKTAVGVQNQELIAENAQLTADKEKLATIVSHVVELLDDIKSSDTKDEIFEKIESIKSDLKV